MKFDISNKRTWGAAVLGGLLTAALGGFLHEFAWGRGLRSLSYDLLHVARGDQRVEEAVLVYLDEISYQNLGQPNNKPFDRELHARLIERLTQAGARAIVFDVVFNDPNPERAAADARLVQAVKSSGRTVLGADQFRAGPGAKTVQLPFDALADVAASMGLVEIVPDRDLTIRQHTPENPREDQYPSLSWAAAEWLKAPATTRPNVRYAPRWLKYYGAPGTIRGFSYYECLDRTRVGDEVFRDKVVFVGARLMTKLAHERKDEYRNPYDVWVSEDGGASGRTPFISGVEIQATMCLNLLRGDWLTRMERWTEFATWVVLGLVLGAGLVWLRPLPATCVAVGLMGALAAAAYGLFVGSLIWVPWLIGVVEGGVALLWSVMFNSIQLYVQKRLQDHTLRLFLPPNLVKKFSRNPALLKPGAEEHEITIFFSDLADFTAWSQSLKPAELAKLMNAYFETAVSECIHRTEGTLVKYIGDAIFAFWNAPDLQPDHARRACEAALSFQKLPPQIVGGTALRTRIGIHTGSAHVGNFGSAERVDYTALGESVNLASRLEGLNKFLRTDCVISRATRDQAGDSIVTRPVGRFQLKGYEQAVEVFELIGLVGDAEASREWREAFGQALNNFEARNLEFAEAGFRRVLELRPEDGPTKLYLQRIDELREQVLPEEWATHTVMRDK